MNRKHG